jgi:hypothetical protein
MPARRRHHCRAPNRSMPCPTGMPPRSAAPATPPSGAGLPRTRAAVVDRAPTRETQIGTRTARLEPRRDRSLRWRVHGCAGMSAKSAKADLGGRAFNAYTPSKHRATASGFQAGLARHAVFGESKSGALVMPPNRDPSETCIKWALLNESGSVMNSVT